MANAEGANLMQLMAIILTVTSVILAALAIFVVFGLGWKYREYVDEIVGIRKDHDKIIEKLENEKRGYKNSLLLNRLSIRVLFDLVMITRRRNVLTRLGESMKSSMVFAGKQLSPGERVDYAQRAAEQVARAEREMMARELELYVIVETSKNRRAHLNSLTDVYGDRETLKLLDELISMDADGFDIDEVRDARAMLRKRCGYLKSSGISASRWTGN